jgi:hypothetical protein
VNEPKRREGNVGGPRMPALAALPSTQRFDENVVRYIVLRITKRPTPTTGPNNVATTIMTNDLPTITQTPHYALNPPTREAPTQPSSNTRTRDRPVSDRICILYYPISFHTFYSKFGHIPASRLRNGVDWVKNPDAETWPPDEGSKENLRKFKCVIGRCGGRA